MSPTIHATRRCEPPAWARLQRRLLATMSEAAREASARYSFPDGTATFVDDVDDVYEARAGRGALYALGGDDDLRRIARREWEATTRLFDDAGPGCDHPKYVAQLTAEYYNLAAPFEGSTRARATSPSTSWPWPSRTRPPFARGPRASPTSPSTSATTTPATASSARPSRRAPAP